jgi:hypothetical protein
MQKTQSPPWVSWVARTGDTSGVPESFAVVNAELTSSASFFSSGGATGRAVEADCLASMVPQPLAAKHKSIVKHQERWAAKLLVKTFPVGEGRRNIPIGDPLYPSLVAVSTALSLTAPPLPSILSVSRARLQRRVGANIPNTRTVDRMNYRHSTWNGAHRWCTDVAFVATSDAQTAAAA